MLLAPLAVTERPAAAVEIAYRHLKVEWQMDREPTTMEKTFGDFAPKIVELTDQVLFADIWERPGLSKRERSLITVAALIAMNRTEQLRFHIPNAIRNGVTKEEVIEAITHLAFYAGWPSAMSALQLAKELLAGEGGKRDAGIR